MGNNLDQGAETRNALSTPANPLLKAEFKKVPAPLQVASPRSRTFPACGGPVICTVAAVARSCSIAPNRHAIADVINMLAE